jgi:hypothetical protein
MVLPDIPQTLYHQLLQQLLNKIMSFPTNAIDGQLVVVNSIPYRYSTAKTAWQRLPGVQIPGANTIPGNYSITSLLDIGGNLSFGANSAINTIDLSTRTDGVILPNGTTAQRPITAISGQIRYNTTTNSVELYLNGQWITIV